MKKIQFVIKDKHYLANKDIHPKPMSDYVPEWYKDMQPYKPKSKSLLDIINIKNNVKSCPSFVEIFKEGFAILAPCDILLSYNHKTKEWFWKTPLLYEQFEFLSGTKFVDIHNNNQMLNHVPNNNLYKLIFKINLPMKIITPNGYSVRQIPMPYNFNNDWEAMYGVFRSDKIHEVNIQIGYKTHKEEILIKRGEPLCVYIPFKREKFKLDIVDYNKRQPNILLINENKMYSSFFKRTKNIDYYKD
jgi:hypothetical protein